MHEDRVYSPCTMLRAQKQANPERRSGSGFSHIRRCTIDLQRRLTVTEAAEYFDLPKATINRWYTLGHLTDITKDQRGVRLYLLAELVEAELATRTSSNSSRSAKRLGELSLA